jgi:hypothetical protein
VHVGHAVHGAAWCWWNDGGFDRQRHLVLTVSGRHTRKVRRARARLVGTRLSSQLHPDLQRHLRVDWYGGQVTKTRTNNNYSEDKKRKMFKHSSDIEWSILFGRPAETTGDNGKPKRFMAGLRYFIPSANVTVFTSAVTPSSFLDAIAPVFNFDTGAGDTRMVFAGNQALIELSKIFADEVMFEVSNTVKVYGMDFQEFMMPNGKILLKSHPLMSLHSLYKKSAFIVDFDAIKYVTQKGRPDAKATDDVQQKDEDVRRGFIQSDGSLMVDYGGLTCGYLGNISAT